MGFKKHLSCVAPSTSTLLLLLLHTQTHWISKARIRCWSAGSNWLLEHCEADSGPIEQMILIATTVTSSLHQQLLTLVVRKTWKPYWMRHCLMLIWFSKVRRLRLLSLSSGLQMMNYFQEIGFWCDGTLQPSCYCWYWVLRPELFVWEHIRNMWGPGGI